MALNIKNSEVERLASDVASALGESKTEAIRRALLERERRLRLRLPADARAERFQRFLEQEVWTRVPAEQLGAAPTKAEREAILGLGPHGI